MVDVMTLMFGWLAVFFILSILSIVFIGDSPVFRLSESVLMGATVGNLILVTWISFNTGALRSLMQGNVITLIPIGLGIVLFARYTKYGWLARYGIAILIGTGLGVSIRTLVYSQLLVQISSTIQDLSTGINGIISFLIVLAVIIYFLFTFDDKLKQFRPILNPINKFARVSMMIAFGAGYISLLVSVYSLVVSNLQQIVDVIRLTLGA